MRASTRGFTIVEMLVVIGVIALLLGILLPALSGARKRSLKADELNMLRQVGLAWTMYANNNNDATLPGYLEPQVQKRWDVSFDYPDRTPVPPAPDYAEADPNIAGPWTWRLLPFLDYSYQIMSGHRFEDEADLFEVVEEAEEIALEPAFGYNAFYVGGWWEMESLEGEQVPVPRYWSARDVDHPERNINLIARSIGSIGKSSDLIIFCSAALRKPGVYRPQKSQDDRPGWHYVSPPVLAGERQWGLVGGSDVPLGGGGSGPSTDFVPGVGGDPSTIEVFNEEPAPLGRYNGLAALLFADNHVSVEAPGGLLDQRRWIDAADRRLFTHTD